MPKSNDSGKKEAVKLVSCPNCGKRLKEAEELRDSELRYRRLFEAAQDGLLILDADTGKILEVNQFLMDLLGYSRRDFLEKHLWEIGVFKDIAASKAGFLKLKSKDYIRYDGLPLETKGGKKIEVEFVSYVYDVGGKKVIQCNVRNITERKKAEKNLAWLASFPENNPRPNIETDVKGNVTYMNPAAKSQFPRLKKQGIGHPLLSGFERLAAKLRRSPEKSVVREVSSGNRFYEETVWYSKDEGRVRTYITDITERKKAEESLINQSEKLERTVNERTAELMVQIEKAKKLANVKDEFIRNITHELKTPLSVIMGNIQLIRDTRAKGNDKEFEELVGMMDRNAVRLRRSIEDVLELSRIGTLTEYKKERVELRKLADDVAAVYGPIAKKKGLAFEVIVPPLAVTGDPALLPYALENLVSNAVKFTDKGKVTISAECTDGFVAISVSDTGKGISKESQKRLFEKFFKEDPTAPGTGVGLAMVKEVVEGNGGRIEFKSKPRQGTTFTITLPKSGK